MTRRLKYSKEFKQEIIRQMDEGQKSPTELSAELGIKRTLLYRWRDQFKAKGDKAFDYKLGRPKNSELSELERLKRELEEVKEERDILKKAATYFAKNLG